jgi:hypothetical protein
LSNTIALAEKQTVFHTNPGYNQFNIFAYANLGYFGHVPIFEFSLNGMASGITPALTDSTPSTIAAATYTLMTGPQSLFQVMPSIQGTTNLCQWYLVQAPRSSGILVSMGDGSVRLVSPTISGTTWSAACTPRNRDTLGTDW